MGNNGNNSDFHVLLPADGTRHADQIRKQFKTAGYIGDK